MKPYIVSLLMLCLCSAAAYAQNHNKEKKEETVIIKKDAPQTVIEIKNDKIYVDGDEVATITGHNTYKKIIIDGNNDVQNNPGFDDNGQSPTGRKALLGIYTNTVASGSGARIVSVSPGSAADSAGLKSGDIIQKIDTENIYTSKDLVKKMSGYNPGDSIWITYSRNGHSHQAMAVLAAADEPMFGSRLFSDPNIYNNMPGPLDMPFPGNDGMNTFPMWHHMNGWPGNRPRMGISAEDMQDGSGVRILDVKQHSAAEEAGLQQDDIITRLNNEKVNSVQSLQDILYSMKPNEKVSLEYIRDGKSHTTTLSLKKPLRKKDL